MSVRGVIDWLITCDVLTLTIFTIGVTICCMLVVTSVWVSLGVSHAEFIEQQRRQTSGR